MSVKRMLSLAVPALAAVLLAACPQADRGEPGAAAPVTPADTAHAAPPHTEPPAIPPYTAPHPPPGELPDPAPTDTPPLQGTPERAGSPLPGYASAAGAATRSARCRRRRDQRERNSFATRTTYRTADPPKMARVMTPWYSPIRGRWFPSRRPA
jgi:hypothetical protein